MSKKLVAVVSSGISLQSQPVLAALYLRIEDAHRRCRAFRRFHVCGDMYFITATARLRTPLVQALT